MKHMICDSFLLVLVALLIGAEGWAQPETPPPPDGAPPPPPGQEEPAPPGSEEVAPVGGDVITLTNGREIRGFEVMHQTTTEVVVRLSDGIELRLPRDMVQSVEYGRSGPGDDVEAKVEQGALARELQGVKLAPVLSRRLQRPVVSDSPLEIRNTDFIEKIIDISQDAEVPLDVTDAVREIPPPKRQWTTTIPPGSSFFSILHDDLLTKFTDLAVDYHYDEIVLTTRAALQEAKSAAPAVEAPSTSEAADLEAEAPPEEASPAEIIN